MCVCVPACLPVALQRRILCLCLAEDGSILVTGSEDTNIALWGVHCPRQSLRPHATARRTLHGHRAPVACVALCLGQRAIASGDAHGTVLLHSLRGDCEGTVHAPAATLFAPAPRPLPGAAAAAVLCCGAGAAGSGPGAPAPAAPDAAPGTAAPDPEAAPASALVPPPGGHDPSADRISHVLLAPGVGAVVSAQGPVVRAHTLGGQLVAECAVFRGVQGACRGFEADSAVFLDCAGVLSLRRLPDLAVLAQHRVPGGCSVAVLPRERLVVVGLDNGDVVLVAGDA